MNEKQRELATNRLLEIIRSGRPSAPPQRAAESVEPKEKHPVADDTGESELIFFPTNQAPARKEPIPVPSLLDPSPSAEDESKTQADTEVDEETEKLPDDESAEYEDDSSSLRPAWQNRLADLFKKSSGKRAVYDLDGAPRAASLPKLKKKGKKFVTFDIGTSSVKYFELTQREGENEISKASIIHIPPAIRKNQSALNIFLSKTVRDLITSKKADKVSVHVVVPDQAMQIRNVSLPAISSKERINAIKFQLKKDLPFPLEVCELAFTGLDPKLKERQDIEVLAVDNRVMTTRLDLFTEAGIVPLHVTSSPAAAPLLVGKYGEISEKDGAVALVDIGAAKTTITIVDKGKIALCRTIATGGDDFTAVLQGLGLGADGEDLNELQAESYKKEIGLPSEGDTALMRVAILMRPVAERISAELARSLELFRRNTMGGDVQKLLLSGGSALLKRLPEYLTKNLGLDIEIADPVEAVKFAADLDEESKALLKNQGAQFVAALGVALDSDRRQNLLPDDLKTYHRLKKSKKAILPAVAVIMIALTSLYSLELQTLHAIEEQAKTLQSQLAELPTNRASYMVTKAVHDRLLSELGGRDQDFMEIKIEDPEILVYLRALSHLVPDNIYLERFRTRFIPEVELREQVFDEAEDDGERKSVASIMAGLKSDKEGKVVIIKRPVYGRVLELTGAVYPSGTLTDVQLVDFVFSLEKSGYFRDVAVDSAQTLENGKIEFSIICGL